MNFGFRQGHDGEYDGGQGNDSGEGSHVGFMDMLTRNEQKGVDKLTSLTHSYRFVNNHLPKP
jgi:hypothetical protein